MANKFKIRLSQPDVDAKDIAAVVTTLKSGQLVQGPKVVELEEKFASYCGTKYAVAVSSGTAALHCAVHALGISDGDEVITTPFTFIATASCALYERAKVVFADIRDDFLIDSVDVGNRITKKTRAVITVDLFGKLCDYAALRKILPKNTPVIEDACQAVGALRDGKRSGKWGELAAFSLYATKNMMVGEGGMITTDSKEYMTSCKQFRNVGQSDRYVYEGVGYHYRMPEMSAALGVTQLAKLERLTKKRRSNAAKLRKGLSGIPGVVLPTEPGTDHVYHQFTVRITKDCRKTRDEIIAHMTSKGIQVGAYYPKPLHTYRMFAEMGYRKGDFPVAERIASEVLALPVHPNVSDSDIAYIVSTFTKFLGK